MHPALIKCLSATTGISFFNSKWTALVGGSINQVYRVTIASGMQYCCKLNDASKFPQLFAGEEAGLQQLSPYILVPEVVAQTQCGTLQVLLLEWIEPAQPTPAFWAKFGEALASLHSITSNKFGWYRNNFMGALPQDNTPQDDWPAFFEKQRILPLAAQARAKNLLSAKELEQAQKLCERLLQYFPPVKPSLLHGDLWSGNFLCNYQQKPVLIDPATHFGHPATDLALTTLFGGFAPAFYDAYYDHVPRSPNHKEQWDICNLYPLLVHLILFGGSYYGQVTALLRRYGS